jgi:hypothetical protein
MSSFAPIIQALLLLALPLKAQAAAGYAESGPRDLKSYIEKGKLPNYIRIDLKGINIRTSPDFSSPNASNVDFKTAGGDLFAVESVKPMHYGAAVQIHVDDDLRWVYVPYERKNDFQFCESEGCFTAMARSIDYLNKGSSVSVETSQDCQVSTGAEGLVLPRAAAPPHHEPAGGFNAPLSAAPVRVPALQPTDSFRMHSKPLWETARGAQGENWTQMMSAAIDKYGQKLVQQRNLKDAAKFCPRFATFDEHEKKEFWIHLLSGVARYESNFKLGVPVYDEVHQRDVYAGPIDPLNYSMGLFQLSYGAADYGEGCKMSLAQDRHKDISDSSLSMYNAKAQMECAVTIMNRWVSRDGAVGLSSSQGGARYWSTLRSSNPATAALIRDLHSHDPACFK